MGSKNTPAVEDRVDQIAQRISRWAAPKVANALAWAEVGLGESTVRAKLAGTQAANQMEDTVDKITPKFQSGIASATSALATAANKVASGVQDGMSQARQQLEHARDQVQNEYVPAASGRLADWAGQANRGIHDAKVSPAVEDALTKLTGDKKAVKKLRKAGEKYTKAAQKELNKHAKENNGGKGWLVVGIVAAAGAAAFAVWQLTKPVEDPWKNPAPKPLDRSTGAAGQPVAAPKPAPVAGTPAAAGTAGTAGAAGTAATPAAPATTTAPAAAAGGNAVVDSTDKPVNGTPAPKPAGR